MAQQKTRRRKSEEEEPEQLEEQSEEVDDDREGSEDDSDGDASEVGFRLRDDGIEIDLPRDGNEGKTLHAIADMLDAMA